MKREREKPLCIDKSTCPLPRSSTLPLLVDFASPWSPGVTKKLRYQSKTGLQSSGNGGMRQSKRATRGEHTVAEHLGVALRYSVLNVCMIHRGPESREAREARGLHEKCFTDSPQAPLATATSSPRDVWESAPVFSNLPTNISSLQSHVSSDEEQWGGW